MPARKRQRTNTQDKRVVLVDTPPSPAPLVLVPPASLDESFGDCSRWVNLRNDSIGGSEAQIVAVLQQMQKQQNAMAAWYENQTIPRTLNDVRLSAEDGLIGERLAIQIPETVFEGKLSEGLEDVINRQKTLDPSLLCQLCQLRLQVLAPMSLPPSGECPGPDKEGWCRVNSKEALLERFEEAAKLGRLVLLGAAYQIYYYERIFAKWASEYPRLMFATVKIDSHPQPIFNDRELTNDLFGSEQIFGCCFASVANGAKSGRSFSGMDRSGQEVREALLNRYHASVLAGDARDVEDVALKLSLNIRAGAAFRMLCARLTSVPKQVQFQVRVYSTKQPGISELACSSPLSSSHREEDCRSLPVVKGLGTQLRAAQWQSIQWMIKREKTPQEVMGEERFEKQLPGYEISLGIRAKFEVRGGVLADTIGFGKTLCSLILISITKEAALPDHYHLRSTKLLPSKATLVVVPPHLLSEWMKELTKHFNANSLKMLCIERLTDLQETSSESLQRSDIVLVSSRLWESPLYQELLGMNLRQKGTRDSSYIEAVDLMISGHHHLRNKKQRDLATKVLERFSWRRLIVDEVHEMYASEGEDIWALPVFRLVAGTRWGLTGTPPSVAEDVHGASRVLGAHVGPAANIEFVESFLSGCIHKSEHSGDIPELPAPLELVVNVRLSPEEWLLYRQGLHERARQLRTGNLQAYEDMLQLCSYFTLRRQDLCKQNGPEAEVKCELERREQEANIANRQLQAAKDSLSAVKRLLQSEENSLEKILHLRGVQEERIDQVKAAESRSASAQASLTFFHRTMDMMQNGGDQFQCPICLQDSDSFVEAAITPCMHVYCVSCVQAICRDQGACATCRQPLHSGDWSKVASLQAALRGPPSTPASKYGAKIDAVATKLQQIRQSEPQAKCLVYVQWDSLKLKLLTALSALGIRALCLQGNPLEMRKTLAKFEQTKNSDEYVLLLSLQKKAAGMNLQCANHVLLVHPFFATHHEHCIAWEAQAIGRAHRQGQTKMVTIHRFIALGTIEEELLVQGRLGKWKKYFEAQ